jgi:hypothetical protein
MPLGGEHVGGTLRLVLQRVKGVVRRQLGLDRVNDALTTLTLRADAAEVGVREAERRLGELEAFRQVMFGGVVVEQAPVRGEPVISVVLATRDRREVLETAIASVLHQSWPHWQLVVVDDGSTDDTAPHLATVTDPRVLVVRTAGVGAAAARNAGLAAATGDWVAFLDDDNMMGASWLRGIAEFAGRMPEAQVLYGGQLRQVEPGTGPVEQSYFWYVTPFDRDRLIEGNFIDLGALAVRRGAEQLWFDPSLTRFIDWEMVVRLAAAHDVHPVPVLSGVYFTSHPSRITHLGDLDEWKAFSARLRDPADAMGRPRTPA